MSIDQVWSMEYRSKGYWRGGTGEHVEIDDWAQRDLCSWTLFHLFLLLQLAAIKLARYGEDLLFYLYYMNGGDLLQLLAAVEL